MSDASKWTHGPALEPGGARFRLWAPAQDRVSVIIENGERDIPMESRRRRLLRGLRRGRRRRSRSIGFELVRRERVPDPASRFQPQDVHGPSESIDHAAYPWREDWRGRAWDGRRPLRTAYRRLHRRRHVPSRRREARPSRRTRRDRGRDHAGRRFPRTLGLGLRRRAALRARLELRPPGGFQGLCRRRACARHRGAARRRLQPFRPGGQLPAALRARLLHQTAIRRPGATRSISMARTPARSAISSSRTPNTGSRSFISTGCGSTRSHAIKDDSKPRHPRGARRARARAVLAAGASPARERGQRSPAARAPRTASRSATRRSGTTTSTTCCMSRRPANGAAITATYGDDEAPRPGAGGRLRLSGRDHGLPRHAARRAERDTCRRSAFVAFIQNHDQIGNRAFGERI